MKKYEQIILKFKISDLKNDSKLEEVQQQLAAKGEQGFKLINSHIHSTTEVKNDGFRYLFCIMERENSEASDKDTIYPMDDDWGDDEWESGSPNSDSTNTGELKSGALVDLASGGQVKIIKELGRGGQGIVYFAEFQENKYALKLYTKQLSDGFYNNLKHLIDHGSPSKSFLWPLMLTKNQYDSYGYVMELRPPEYKEFGDFLLAKVKFSNVSAILNTALQMCEGMLHLHDKSLFFQSFSDENLLICPDTGDVLFVENEDIATFGRATGIMGKSRYIASEVVNGNLPDIYSDYYSLSIMLFLLFFRNHPLEGMKVISLPVMTESAEKRFFGSEALFIYDKDNQENLPVSGVHQNVIKLWPQYPEILRNSFLEAFSQEKLKNPDQRLTPAVWKKVIIQLKKLLITDKDGHEFFADK